MLRHVLHFAGGAAVVAALLARAGAADDEKPAKKEAEKPPPRREFDEYRQFFKTPETASDYWRALNFEMDLGQYDLAAKYLRGFLDKKPGPAEVLDIINNKGITAFLRLRLVPKWHDDKKMDAQIRGDVETLIKEASITLERHLADRERIDRFIKNLSGEPEERAFALAELYRSGKRAMPHLIEAARESTGDRRQAVLSALARLGPDTLPPLVAALDADDNAMRVELLDVIQKRGAREAVPHLWHLYGSPKLPPFVRQKAAAVLGKLTDTSPDLLPPAREALVREANKYYRHQVSLPAAVSVWRWDAAKKAIVEGWPGVTTVPTTVAEEYYGLLFAGRALDMDPSYAPAQLAYLNVALDKGVEKVGVDKPLGPDVATLLATVSPDLVNTVLDRALTEGRGTVALAAVRALGDSGSANALRPGSKTEPALVRALSYGDRRVQTAAALALVRIPAPPPAGAAGRVVDVLRRAVAAEPRAVAAPKVLLGFFDENDLRAATAAAQQAGFEAVPVRTGRQLVQRLAQASDIDAIVLHHALPDPQLSHLLGQLRADVAGRRLPTLLAAPADRVEAMARFVEKDENIAVMPEAGARDGAALKAALEARLADDVRKPLGKAELKDYAERSLKALARMARGEVAGYDAQPTAAVVLQALRSNELSDDAVLAAAEVAGRLTASPEVRPQTALAAFVVGSKRPAPLRQAVAQELSRNIQQQGSALSKAELQSLTNLIGQDGEPALKAGVAAVLGSARPDAGATGRRLRGFAPAPPAAAAPPAEKKEEAPKEEKPPEKAKEEK